MKKVILLFIAIFLYTTINAQEFEVIKSDIFKDKKKHSFLSFSLDDGQGGLITIRKYLGGFPAKTIKGYYIQHFDADLKLIKEYDYKVKKNTIQSAFIKDRKLNLIEKTFSRKEKKLIYNVKTTDIKEFNFSEKELLSISENNIKKYFGVFVFPIFINNGLNQRDKNHSGQLISSENNNFFAIIFDVKNEDTETHKAFVFKNNFELQYEKTITKDIKDKLFEYNNTEVDDEDGSIYFLGKSFENNSKKKKKRDGKANYHFELTKINKNLEENVSFKEPEKFIGSLSLVKKNNQLSCVGFYGNKKEFKYNGLAVYKLNPNSLVIEHKKFNPFSEEFLFDKYGDNKSKKKRKAKKGITNIDFRNVQALDNGDLVINAEEYYMTTHTTSSMNGGFRTYTVYHFDDIISLRINTNGDLIWARNINKNQTGFSNSSFTTVTHKGKTNLFINCSDKIKKMDGNRLRFPQTSAKKSNLYCITINNDGKIDFKKLVDDKDSKVYYKVNNGTISKNKDEVIFLGKRKKNSQIIKVKIRG